MSASLLRGLRVLEMLHEEPIGISEIARRLGVDKGGVSRVMAALEREGWVERTGRRFVLGSRTLLLVDESGRALIDEASRVARRLHRETGRTVAVLQRRGSGAQPLALRASQGAGQEADFRDHAAPFEHLCATAGGVALLAQLPDAVVDQHLALDPWPLSAPTAPAAPDQVRELIAQVRGGEPVAERSWTVPGQACVALPWPGHSRPLAVAVLGPEDELGAQQDEVVAAMRTALSG
jgi:DNA-binding IclR family transcriptional regulator